MNGAALAVAAFALAGAPEVQRPSALEGGGAAPTEPESPDAGEAEAAVPPAEDDEAEPDSDEVDADATEEPEPEPHAEEAEPEPKPDESERFTVSAGERHDGPPFYSEADAAELRTRHKLEANPPEDTRKAKWRCLIADPTCGINFEINAMGAYAYRGRQGDTRGGNNPRWHSGRAQYDFWMNFPVMAETRGKTKYQRMTLGPKGGVIFSDTGSLWGNIGMAGRYWLGRGRFAPAIEFTSALSYKLGSRPTQDLGGAKPKFRMTRGPVGFTADVGISIGGFGAIVVGGQYDSPLAREDVPEQFRVSAGGTFFVGFRGNILWGGPLAAAVLTHGLTQRLAEEP